MVVVGGRDFTFLAAGDSWSIEKMSHQAAFGLLFVRSDGEKLRQRRAGEKKNTLGRPASLKHLEFGAAGLKVLAHLSFSNCSAVRLSFTLAENF